ncbi:hypothetical protein BD560DRAFT_419793 [Blakeslea trispora]|nr:hypothetical protein BD560DRAFT_419793 [Blakeslea trispora]
MSITIKYMLKISMAKGKEKTSKKQEKITRKQKRALQKSLAKDDPEDLDSQLRNLGLCTKNITGDGNCLFRALSDQYEGHDGNHKAIRQEICQYLRENEDTYKHFVEDDQSFEHHVDCMTRNGTFGGNMELVAFAKLKKVDIKGAYEEQEIDSEEELGAESEIMTLHIAYHNWEHYSSVRNIEGPYSGPPEIKIHQNNPSKDSDQEEQEQECLTSVEKVVRNACADTSVRKIRRLLIKYKGNPDKVIDAIYESEQKNKIKKEQQTNEGKQDESNNPADNENDQQNTFSSNPQIQEIDLAQDNAEGNHSVTEKVDDAVPEENKPKKPSASERKREAKKRQKEAKMLKEQAKAARKLKYKQEKTKEDTEELNKDQVVQQMKEMNI